MTKSCNVRKCDERKNDDESFFDKTRNIVIFFISLGGVAALLTIVTVGIREEYGGVISIGVIYWDFNIFVSYIIGFVVTPLIILYVVEKRKKVLRY